MFSTGKFQITISTLLSGGFFRGSGKEIVTISRYTKPCDDAETDLRTRKSLISGPTHRLNGGSAPLSAKIGSDQLRILMPDPADGVGHEGIVRPGVLGVAATKFLPDLEVGPFPEAPQVGSQLDGLEARRQKFH